MNRLLHNLGDNFACRVMSWLPAAWRMKAHGRIPQLDRPLSKSLIFKLAQTKEELEACFRLLHDEYVRLKYMKPDPSGMRIMIHHALPTTSTLMCQYKQQVIGTVSLIRESGLGFPMQRIFNLDEIFSKGGNVAEVSALAIDKRFRSMKDRVLIPLLKFLYEYAEYRFDAQHLVIAVNPRHICFYEDILCFQRIHNSVANHYDFVNGAPAIGAYLDLEEAKEKFSQKYAKLPSSQNLYHYFTATALPNGRFPHRRFHTTTDPVMTPELIDYFFNQQTQLFSTLDTSDILLLHSVYDLPEYQHCLPAQPKDTSRKNVPNPAHRFPVKCPAYLQLDQSGTSSIVVMTVYECTEKVLCVHAERPLLPGSSGEARINVGELEYCSLPVKVMRLGKHNRHMAMLHIGEPHGPQGRLWLKFVQTISNAPLPVKEARHLYDEIPDEK